MTRPEDIVLGVDPGSRHTGLAVIRGHEILFVDVLHTASINDHADRISEIYTSVQAVIRRWGAQVAPSKRRCMAKIRWPC